jgi:methylglutamate dehydrogenase subunit D
MSESHFQLRRLADISVVSLQAARGRTAALLERAPLTVGVALRDGPHRVAGHQVDSLGVGVHRWLLLQRAAPEHWPETLARALTGDAAVCDQSDAYVLFEAAGSAVRAVLARGVPVDLRPQVLTTDDVAVTQVGHTNVVLWSESADPPRFRLAVARSYADSFEHFIATGA